MAIVGLLLEHGARVDRSHIADWEADASGSHEDQQILAMLSRGFPAAEFDEAVVTASPKRD